MATADAMARDAAKKKLATTKAFGLTVTPRAPVAKKPSVSDIATEVALDVIPGARFLANTGQVLSGTKVEPAKMQSGYIGLLPLGGGIRAATTALGATKAGARALGAITPAGLQAVGQTAKAVKRSAPSSVMGVASQGAASRGSSASLYGPGSYYATGMGPSVNRWKEYGNIMSGIATTPAAKLKIAQGKGYVSPELLNKRIAELSAPGTDITTAGITDPAVQSLIQEGYIGLRNPADGVLTSWTLGDTPGMTRKALGTMTPNQMWENPSNVSQKAYNYVRSQGERKGGLEYLTNKQILERELRAKKEALNLAKKLREKKANELFLNQPKVEG